MSDSKELESYLTRLDKALGQISVSERAEIVTEIKSHIMDAQEIEPDKSLGSILASLGEPEQVASRYLLERGLSLKQPPRHPIVKWLVIGVLGTFFLIMMFIFILIWKFTPFVEVDEEKGRVKILGGLIDVNEEKGSVKIGSFNIDNDTETKQVEGEQVINKDEINFINIPFVNGKFELMNSLDNIFRWNCNIIGKANDPIILNDKSVEFALSKNGSSKCSFKIPSNTSVNVNGSNAKIKVLKPLYNININSLNGQVVIIPHAEKTYKYDMSVTHGEVDSFKSNDSNESYKISVNLMNGLIKNN